MRGIVVLGIVGIISAGLLLGGCADPNTKPRHLEFGSSRDTLVMGPALRLVTERPRPLTSYGPAIPTVCTEPMPDVAVAFGRSLAAQGSFANQTGTNVSGSLNAATTETATQLAGRTAGVLALRDGLYAACQSYANGILGHDAYAMILSQYGHLLVALAGTGTNGNPEPVTAQEAAISALLVACVSENDPTRIRPIGYKGKPIINPLLTPYRCKLLMNKIASGRLLAPAKKTAAAKPKPGKPLKLAAGEELTTTTATVTKKVGPAVK